MRKILIIGAGGIGSFLIPLLSKVGLYDIVLYDPDSVEKKNLTYQNYEEYHIGEPKVASMDARFNLKQVHPYPVLTEGQMKGYDLVVSCVDNLSTRRTMYRIDRPWLDLRAQGRNAALISSLADAKQYDTMLAGPEGSFSCQGDTWDGSAKSVHFMQVVIAAMGAQWIQRWFNGEDVTPFKVVNL